MMLILPPQAWNYVQAVILSCHHQRLLQQTPFTNISVTTLWLVDLSPDKHRVEKKVLSIVKHEKLSHYYCSI